MRNRRAWLTLALLAGLALSGLALRGLAARGEMAAAPAVLPAHAPAAIVAKAVVPTGTVEYGSLLMYTLDISATPGVTLGVYDPLSGTTFVRFVERPAGVIHIGDAVTGGLTMPASPVLIRFVARVAAPAAIGTAVSLTNRACVYALSGGRGACQWSNLVANSAIHPEAVVYLPAMLKVWPAAQPQLAGCGVLPGDNIWNTPIDSLPVDSHSDAYVNAIGAGSHVHPDFGSGTWEGFPIGIPYNVVPGTQPGLSVAFEYADESDAGPYPIPPDPLVEGDPNGDGDRHILIVERDHCILYELYAAHREGDGWHAGSGAVFDLGSHALRPAGWTSADAAGLPILPGLVRYDEVAGGEIRHALRFTAPRTQRAYVWPARHYASSITDPNYPPMGQRFRLKASYDISGFSPEVQVILRALKKYGLILADNGSAWYLSGVPDERWNNDVLVGELHRVPGSAFEAVDVSSLMIDPDSGQARPGAP